MARNSLPISIIVLCTGNICRSPMGELLLHRQLQDDQLLEHVRLVSAGTHGLDGSPVPQESFRVMRGHGYDLSRHRGQSLTEAMVDQADLIIGMEPSHLRIAAGMLGCRPDRFPRKFRLWSSFNDAATAEGIDDPYGMGQDAYEQSFAQIKPSVRGIALEIRRLIEERR